MPDVEVALAKLGESWDVPEEVFETIGKFTCHMYGQPRFEHVNKLRLHLLIKKCEKDGRLDSSKTIDIASLPPCSNTLFQHVKRTNYQVAIWRQALEKLCGTASSNRAWTVCGFMEPLWCEGDILPQQLIDIIKSHEMQEPEETDGIDFAYLSDSDTPCDDDNEM